MKIHIDHNFTDIEENMLGVKMPIGCSDCMERCSRCGAWHFQLLEYTNVISKGYTPINSRKFLKNFSKKSTKANNYCSCKENLVWIYDEMSLVKKNGKTYYESIVDKFLSGACKAAFINYLTGEFIASYKDYIIFLHEYLLFYLSNNVNVYNKFVDSDNPGHDYEKIRDRVHNFVDRYIVNEENEFGDFSLNSYIAQSIVDYKKGIADSFNVSVDLIKVTSSSKSLKCSSCNALYYADVNSSGEYYFNSVKDLCCCCDEALSNNYKMWNRADDGVLFYKSKNKNTTIRTFQSNQGEVLFEKWVNQVLEDQVQRIEKSKDKKDGEKHNGK